MSPLDSPGADVDIEDGTPVETESVAVHQEKRKEKTIARYISNYQEIVNDLAGEGGATLRKVAAMYANRINEVVREDPACLAFQAIFDELKIQISVGETLANAKIREIDEKIGKGL